MGGKTFGVEARRLTSEQHSALFNFVKSQLVPFTPFGVRTTISPGDKTSHGDLDVMIGSWAEGPGFKYQFAGQADETAVHPPTPADVWQSRAGTKGYQWSEEELRGWIRDVARAVGAIVWQKHRIGAIFAVPCSVLGELTAEVDSNECFQVDLNIVRPDRLDFGEFILSYGITPLFVNQVVKQLSPAFKIHHEHLALRHSPYPGEPVIAIEITNDARDLLDWLGLDYDQWKKGFSTQHEYQVWLAGLPEDTHSDQTDSSLKLDESRPVIQGWKSLVKQTTPIKDTSGHQKERIQKLEDFRDWLRSIHYAADRHPTNSDTASDALKLELPSRCIAITTTTKTTFRVDPKTLETVLEKTESQSTTAEAPIPQNTGTITEIDDQWSNDPIPLDYHAISVLERFGKNESYEEALEARKREMTVKLEHKRRKQQNRDFAQKYDNKDSREAIKVAGRWV